MFYFCTLFDSFYLTRGLAMYESLKKHCNDFHLFIFPFDDKCYEVLTALNLKHVTLISLNEFEDKELLAVKSVRSRGEYCWTATSSTILYCIEKFNLEHCTYLDSDLYFYDSPALLLKEVEGNSILITEHRYSPKYDISYYGGKYCVQFVYFRNDENGIKALKWWRNACLEWCYDRLEDGKFGDQRYLEDWTTRFNGVVELQHLGGGVAPWNVQQYRLYKKENRVRLQAKNSKKEYPLVFYHFHEMKFYSSRIIFSGTYKLNKEVRNLIYRPYITSIFEVAGILKDLFKVDFKERKGVRTLIYIIKFLLFRVNIIVIWPK